ncbi:hypothetical protein M1328_01890 [Patescibacteria group bacterium]|nr:hypothetical protein [Patescibacteria group bacterium]
MLLAQVNIQDKFAPAKVDSIGKLLSVVLPLASAGAALIFLIMALRGALMFLTSGDNPDGLKKAQSTLVFAVIGLLIVIVSFVAVQLIGKLLGVSMLF